MTDSAAVYPFDKENITSEQERARLGKVSTVLCCAILLFVPFCSIRHFGILGNFDSNLALYPFLAVLPLLVTSVAFWKTLAGHSPEAVMIRMTMVMLILAAFFTVINGIFLDSIEYKYYDLDPIEKSLITANVPILIGMLFLTSVTLAQRLPIGIFRKYLNYGFWLTVSYTVIQVLSSVFPNGFYDAIWTFVEGAKDRGGLPYFETFHRFNGPTSEPAELCKLLLIFYMPWIVFPIGHKIQWRKVALLFFCILSARSIIGFIMLAAIVPIFFVYRRISLQAKILTSFILVGLSIYLLGQNDQILGGVLDRIGNLQNDASTTIRAFYNRVAFDLVLENPFIGVGWSNEIYFYPQRVAPIANLWEVQQNIQDGVSLTARSLILRLLMYTGLPLFSVFVYVIVVGLSSFRSAGRPVDRARTRLTYSLLLLGGMLDGGIVTSFYIWVAPAIALGFQMRHSANTDRSSLSPSL